MAPVQAPGSHNRWPASGSLTPYAVVCPTTRDSGRRSVSVACGCVTKAGTADFNLPTVGRDYVWCRCEKNASAANSEDATTLNGGRSLFRTFRRCHVSAALVAAAATTATTTTRCREPWRGEEPACGGGLSCACRSSCQLTLGSAWVTIHYIHVKLTGA